MTSYGGIIRIRLWVEVDDFLSACRYKLPCILLQAHYTRFIRKMQALPWEGGRGAAFVLVLVMLALSKIACGVRYRGVSVG